MSTHLFAALAALAREEHGLVTDGRFDELADVADRRRALMAQLPPAAPPEALPHVREAARLQALITVALRDARDATADELRRLRTSRTGAQGYAAGAGAAPSRPVFDQAG
ncbi:MAG TPA: hypothetical protein VFT50_08660 [Baekduia sp.]|nr:hypothetical protein [Baekduia sp.]